jgi:hypothetical protein
MYTNTLQAINKYKIKKPLSLFARNGTENKPVQEPSPCSALLLDVENE